MGFDDYLSSFRDSVPVERPVSPELAEELRGHLEDAAYDLQLAGMRREASEQEAMRRLGRPELIAAAFSRQPRRTPSSLLRRPRLLLAVAALSVGLLGGAAVAAAHAEHSPATVTFINRQ
jgi:hypothetical protein